MIKYSGLLSLVLSWLIAGCVVNDSATKRTANGLITTPPSYYSTAKAKYLGTKYKENLDRLVERIVRNPKTATLQFANNISSVGGIGFFTHSATKTPDERYLEVVLATPETFETKGEYSEKVHQLFARYGRDLLGIVSGDNDVYQDRELSGYGLNLAWRMVIAEATGKRVAMARAIIYFPKERVRSYLRDELSQNELLGEAVIFGEEENGPLALVSYQPQNPRPDFRPTIREDNLASVPVPAKPDSGGPPVTPTNEVPSKIEPKVENAKKESPPVQETEPRVASKPKPAETKGAVKTGPVEPQRRTIPEPKPDSSSSSLEASVVATPGPVAEPVATTTESGETPRGETPVSVTKAEPLMVTPPPPAAPIVKDPVPAVEAKLAEPKPAPAAMVPAKTTPASKSAADVPSIEPMQIPEVTVEKTRQPVPKSGAGAKDNLPEVKANKELAEPTKSVVLFKPIEEHREKAKTTREAMPKKIPAAAAPIAQTPDKQTAEEYAHRSIPPVAKSEKRPVVIDPPVASTTPREPQTPAKASTPQVLAPPVAKTPPLALAREEKTPEPVPAKLAPVREEKPAVTAPKEIPEVKELEPNKQQPTSTIVASRPKADAAPQKNLALTATPKENFEEKSSSAKTSTAASPSPPLEKTPQRATPAPPAAKSAPVSVGEKKDSTVVESRPAVPAAVPAHPEKVAEKPAGEQLALLKNKPVELVPGKKSLTRPSPKALEGFIIQLAFNDREKAQHWAETMERRGFAVSITEAGADGALRVRLGNFAVRDEAERQLRTFKQDGMSGIIINLPQAFRPEARSSMP